MKIIRTAGIMTLALGMAACNPGNVKEDVVKEADTARKGPQAEAKRSITNFSDSLRCMDNMMISYGVRDVTMMAEDLVDSTKKVSVGSRDMVISAISDMTRRSRAVKLSAYGQDSSNVIGFLQNAKKETQFQLIPQYDIRGSISQMDENILRKQADTGIGFEGKVIGFGVGRSKSASANVIAMDLSIIKTDDLSIIPGVISKNQMLVMKEGDATDSEASIKKFGINFSQSIARNEGNAAAVRNLFELATIELFGRLLKLPYWKCLSIPDDNDEVKREVSDWFYSMAANGELTPWVQTQLRVRGYYDGSVDGIPTPQLEAAISEYKTNLGVQPDGKVDEPFFVAMLNRPVPPRKAVQRVMLKPGDLVVEGNLRRYKPGDVVNLTLRTNQDAYVYCFHQSASKQIMRFYPNRFSKDAFLKAGSSVQIPGQARFRMTANGTGGKEMVACFASARDVYPDLPAQLRVGDFEPVSVPSTDPIKQAFAVAAAGNLADAVLNIDVAK